MIDGGARCRAVDCDAGGHKGFCLAAMVDVLSGRTGDEYLAPFALRQEMPTKSVGKGIGDAFGAIHRIDGFIDPADFKSQMDDWVRTFRATKPSPDTSGVVVPGDPERQAMETRLVSGIPLLPAVISDLRDISAHTGIAFE